jgi:hypothetical protein
MRSLNTKGLKMKKTKLQEKFQMLLKIGLIICVSVQLNGCVSDKPLIMNRDGLYKFTDKSPAQKLLFLNENKEWEITHKKVQPSTEMIIFYETN